jgi:hypothetical protein
MEKGKVRPLVRKLRNEGTEEHRPQRGGRGQRLMHCPQGYEEAWQARAGKGSGESVPSPEDVEADVAFEVNVGMINHCLTLHLGWVVWVTLAHLAPEKEKGDG